MHPALTTNYLIPAILLNPVLFLHSLNTLLSRILPPIVAAGPIQPSPYSTLGPSANYPHLDVHASDNLCWSYTAVMVCAQLVAFGRVSQAREEGRERKERKREREERGKALNISNLGEDKQAKGGHRLENGSTIHVAIDEQRPVMGDDSEGTEEEIIL
ncbi:hypothetical protein MMC26_007369 [Xylographa opegraphella]|nr:hypothetical protein [Xylographa opegraphella]